VNNEAMNIVLEKGMKQNIMLQRVHTYHQAESSDKRKAGGQRCAGEDVLAVAQVTDEHERHEQEARVERIREGNRQPELQLPLHLIYDTFYLHFTSTLSPSLSTLFLSCVSRWPLLYIHSSSYIETPLKFSGGLLDKGNARNLWLYGGVLLS
jgi:hypothetical protein